jgi:DNA gyrase inhibitor GyrI
MAGVRWQLQPFWGGQRLGQPRRSEGILPADLEDISVAWDDPVEVPLEDSLDRFAEGVTVRHEEEPNHAAWTKTLPSSIRTKEGARHD